MCQQIRMTVFALIACAAFAQNGPSSQGETALKTQFVEVQPDVKLEVLDWGGAGRNLVLLAGGGSTAHVFDSLGPKLAAHYHVIGSRGAGLASPPRPKRVMTQGGSEMMSSRFLTPCTSLILSSSGIRLQERS
jgi:non-heme chloroperoxidase